jgi:hypothetical protein
VEFPSELSEAVAEDVADEAADEVAENRDRYCDFISSLLPDVTDCQQPTSDTKSQFGAWEAEHCNGARKF